MMQGELTVVTKAKDMCRYILAVTEKSPKRFRFTLVSRMQNLSLETIKHIYRANEIYMSDHNREAAWQQRLDLQHAVLTSVKLLKQGIDYLGFHLYLTDSGKVIRKLRRSSKTGMKRRLRLFRQRYAAGEMEWADTQQHMAIP